MAAVWWSLLFIVRKPYQKGYCARQPLTAGWRRDTVNSAAVASYDVPDSVTCMHAGGNSFHHLSTAQLWHSTQISCEEYAQKQWMMLVH